MRDRREQALFIPGPSGRLEAMISGLTFVGSSESSKTVGVICHPHPLYQGTMQNKVVTTLVSAFQAQDFATVRFNFRGVGQSEGEYDQGIGETDDLRAVLAWIRAQHPHVEIWMAGFSFGAFVALKVAAEYVECKGLISVAPALTFFDFSLLKPPACPWLIVQGEKDELVDKKKVMAWHRSLLQLRGQEPPCQLVMFQEATHFFHGQLQPLKESMVQFLKLYGGGGA